MNAVFRLPATHALAVPGFRRYLLGQLVSNIGTWMQRAAQDLLVLHTTGNSGSAVGIVTALQFLPQTLLGLTGGVLADRYPKRRTLLLTQTAMAAQSLLLGLLTVTGAVNLPSLYALAFALGTATAVDSPARNAYICELVSHERAASAVSLNAAQFNTARAIGPALAGLAVAAFGTGPVFLLNTASYLAVLYGLITIRTDVPDVAVRARPGRTRAREALRHIAATPELLLPVTLVAFVGTFGLNFQVTVSLVALTVFHTGAATFGYLSAAYALGSLLGAIHWANHGRPPTVRRLVSATIGFGALEVAQGLMPGYGSFLVLLFVTGCAAVTVTTTANALIQLHADPPLRGRVLSVYFLVLLGGTPVGAPLVGLVSDTLGARFTLVLGGVVSLATALALSVLFGSRTRRRIRITEPTPVTGSPFAPVPAERERQPGL
ncbi:MFS transporter [Streptomyces sp. Ag109_O5-10]|uniref:MFS transporter n=1 Tax=Streptomyces sp. Ag109_O5-10 TaxID=1855349 RepID=UPI00089954EB|nr:MFS transporter [Streptomyces sp. Ag109_O5-10]SEE30412.1 Predicted arabinose efflux permease, MFS family [Streptomyces sp. Ag109_O5-10]